MIPQVVNTAHLVQSRGDQIKELVSALQSRPKNKRAFQRLPKHLRRRAQSHNPYRIPRHRRPAILHELESSPPKPSRRPRKDRRRPRNLLAEYTARSDKCTWLATHMYHAKRMHMKEAWGFRLASVPVEKCQRKTYRHAARHCVIHDRSYCQVLELSGRACFILATLNLVGLEKIAQLRNEGKGQRQSAIMYEAVMPQARLMPGRRSIGPVDCLWEPSLESSLASESKLTVSESLAHLTKAAKAVNKVAYPQRNYCMDTPQDQKGDNMDICRPEAVAVRRIENTVLYELTGPKSLTRLAQALKLHPSSRASLDAQRWRDISAFSGTSVHLEDGVTFYLELVPSTVLGPFPPRPHNSAPKRDISNNLTTLPAWAHGWKSSCEQTASAPASSARDSSQDERDGPRLIFNDTDRLGCRLSDPQKVFVPTRRSRKRRDISTCRSKCSKKTPDNSIDADSGSKKRPRPQHAPKTDTPAPPSPPRIPAILVFRKGAGHDKFGFGWDLILPGECGASRLWTLLTRLGCHPVGYEDRRRLRTEMGRCEFPWDFPDTKAGEEIAMSEARVRLHRYCRLPPDKRVNFSFLGIVCPFWAAWTPEVIDPLPAVLGEARSISVSASCEKGGKQLSLLLNSSEGSNQILKSISSRNSNPLLSDERRRYDDLFPFGVYLDPSTYSLPRFTNALSSNVKKHFYEALAMILQFRKHYSGVVRLNIQTTDISTRMEGTTYERLKKCLGKTQQSIISVELQFHSLKGSPSTLTHIYAVGDCFNLYSKSFSGGERTPTDVPLFEPPHTNNRRKNIRSHAKTIDSKFIGGEHEPIGGRCDPMARATPEIPPSALPPPQHHLIGFVSSGSHSLRRGSGYGIGHISSTMYLNLLLEQSQDTLPHYWLSRSSRLYIDAKSPPYEVPPVIVLTRDTKSNAFRPALVFLNNP